MKKIILSGLVVLMMPWTAQAQDISDPVIADPAVPAVAAANDVMKAAVSPSPVPSAGTPMAENAQVAAVTPQPTPGVTLSLEKKSIFFTPNQLIAIMRANQGFIAPREAFDENNQGDKPQDAGPRELILNGIVYNSKSDWTIWFNGERVTPKNIPDRIMGLNVEKDRVHIRWMDIGNKRIVNITLLPNQKYLLDSDTIVPAGT